MTLTSPSYLALLGLPGGWEWVVILVIGLLLFGSRLPSIGKNVGKSITEFKKGLKEASAEMNAEESAAGQNPAPRQLSQEQILEQATQEAVRRMKAEQQK